MTKLLTREFTIRAEADDDARTVTGLAVPYGQIIERYDAEHGTAYERFEPGSVEPHPDGHMYFYGHGEPIGLVTAERDTDDGHEITAKISATARGDEVYTLLRDGVLTKHSIGFYPVEARVDKVRLADDGPEVDVLTRTKVLARETSVVPFPAYDKAGVTLVRDREPEPRKDGTMPDTITREDLDGIKTEITDARSDLTDLSRRMDVIAAGAGSGDEGATELREYRSHGEFVKALASGEARERVEALNRAYEGQTTGDVSPGTNPTWVDRDVKLVENKRPIVNLFNRDALPTEGLTVSYPQFDSKTGDVAKQDAEGDNLTRLTLKIKTGTANVSTHGGAAELTKQVIDRMPASYVNKVLQMIKISYAKNTNTVVRSTLVNATGKNTTIDISANNDEAQAYLGAMVDAVGNIEDNSMGLGLDFVLVGKTDFKTVATLVDADGRPLFGVAGQAVNSFGGLNIKALTLDVGGVPWILDPGLTSANAFGCSAEALTVLESPGAPFALHDENIINLTEAFSLYGYLATTVDDPKGIQPIKVTA